MKDLNKLERMVIEAYEDEKLSKGMEEFKVQFNPQSISRSWQNYIQTDQGVNSTGTMGPFAATGPQSLGFELIFDSSGTTDPSSFPLGQPTVFQKVEDFVKKTWKMKGSTHEPHYLRVIWGELKFEGRLTNISASYTRFNANGDPIRASVSVSLMGTVAEPSGARETSSPDLTHHRVVRTGQTLPQLCNELYGTVEYYLELAKANELDHFRKLMPGVEVAFPPLATNTL